MKNKKFNLAAILSILFSFFVMSFVDLVGTGVDEYKDYAKEVEKIPDYAFQLFATAAFIWFFILSVPIGIWQDRIGKKKMLNIGVLITALALIVPAFGYNYTVLLISFSLIGIGNTILQVSANPLIAAIVPKDKIASAMSLSQLIKSIGSMIGPIVAAFFGPFMAKLLGDDSPGSWRYGLYLFAFISILTSILLSRVEINENKEKQERASMKSCLKMLGNPFILFMVLGIFFVVGIDVAMNTNIGTFLENKLGISDTDAKFGKTVYFFAKMAGTFLGAIILTRFKPKLFLIISAIIAILGLTAMAFTQNDVFAWICIAIISLGVSNIFPLIFSISVQRLPERNNEISGLMMMAISGGAVIPLLAGYAANIHIAGSIFVMLACAVYLLIAGLSVSKK